MGSTRGSAHYNSFFFNEYSGQILKNPARSNQNNNQRTFFFFAEEIHERKYFLGKLL
jgi:hypothetical protein